MAAICRARKRRSRSRTAAINLPTASTKSARCGEGAWSTSAGTWRGSTRSLNELESRARCRPAALSVVMHETVRRNRVRRRHRLCTGHARRCQPRLSLSGGRHQAVAGGNRAQQRSGAARSARRRRRRRRHRARHPLGPRRHQIGRAAAQCAGEAGGARAGRARSLAGRRKGPRHRRRLVQCLDRLARRAR